jgi:hypothetical protein
VDERQAIKQLQKAISVKKRATIIARVTIAWPDGVRGSTCGQAGPDDGTIERLPVEVEAGVDEIPHRARPRMTSSCRGLRYRRSSACLACRIQIPQHIEEISAMVRLQSS